LLSKTSATIIIRGYSSFGHNFVKTVASANEGRESINIVNDQVGSLTYAADLAAAIMHIASDAEDKKHLSFLE